MSDPIIDVNSVEYLLQRRLPEVQSSLIAIRTLLEVKYIDTSFIQDTEQSSCDREYLQAAIIYRAAGRNALSKYPNDEKVKGFMEEIENLYNSIAKYFPGAPE